MRLFTGFAAVMRSLVFLFVSGVLGLSAVGQQANVAAATAAGSPKPLSVPQIPLHRPMFGAQPVRKVPQAGKYGGGRALPQDTLDGIRAAIALPPQTVTVAPFVGDYTAILASPANGFAMARQSNCSLNAFDVPYSQNPSDPYSAPDSTTTNYNELLHSEAGLTTTAGLFTGGCNDPKIGIASSDLLYAGISTGGMRMAAAAVYSPSADNNVLDTFIIKSNGTFVSSAVQPLPATNAPYGVVAGDLNGDGNSDLVAIGFQSTSNGTSTTVTSAITVLTGNADGTFTVGQTYTLTPGLLTDSAVVGDFNKDGKLDVVVAEGGAGLGMTGSLTFFPGNGDGTLGTPQRLALPNGAAEGLVAGDFDGNGTLDIASGTGSIFLGNGDGTFTQVSTPAFAKLQTNSSSTAGLAVGDFNKDGKLDLAAGTGEAVYIYLGNGDGTFTPGAIYASIENHGYLIATDLDGDGNLDLYSGNAQNGTFSGDDFTANEGYALMGRGDGTFVGAPQVTYAIFNQLQDLNGDGKLDFIGNIGGSYIYDSEGSGFATYYGNGDGTFHQAGASFSAGSYTDQGTQYAVTGVDSYAVGDLNGDGHPDLVYIPGVGSVTPRQPRIGFLTALGNADGSFQSPVFVPVPALAVGGGTDYPVQIGNIEGLVNQNGKFEIVYGYETQIIDNTNTVITTTGYATQLSNGDGTFAAPVLTVTYSGNQAPAFTQLPTIFNIADLNGDKIPDLIAYVPGVFQTGGVVVSPTTYGVMLGNADGSFGTLTNLMLPNVPYDEPLSVGDLNGDGIPDFAFIAIVNTQTSTSYYLDLAIGKGDGTFKIPTPLLLSNTIGLGAAAIGDFNNDGKADVAISGSGVYPGNGDGTLQTMDSGFGDGSVNPPVILPLSSGFGPSAAYDVNGDGKMDLVSGGTFLIQTAPISATATNTSATALTASASSAMVGQSVTLTATVTAASGSGTPTGTITFLDSTTSIGTGTLSASGTATLSTTALAAGSHSITASYGGDTNFAGSISSASVITVTAPPPDFAVSLSATSATVSSGSSATTTISIQPSNGFNQAITFACTGLPTGATCTFSPASITPSGTSASTTTLTIATTTASARLMPPVKYDPANRTPIAWAATLLGLTSLARFRRKRLRSLRALQMLSIVTFLVMISAALSGCGGSGNKSKQSQPTTSTVTVTATSGSTSHTATFTLTVQ